MDLVAATFVVTAAANPSLNLNIKILGINKSKTMNYLSIFNSIIIHFKLRNPVINRFVLKNTVKMRVIG